MLNTYLLDKYAQQSLVINLKICNPSLDDNILRRTLFDSDFLLNNRI